MVVVGGFRVVVVVCVVGCIVDLVETGLARSKKRSFDYYVYILHGSFIRG